MHQTIEPIEYKIHWQKWRDPLYIDEKELGEEFAFAKDTFRSSGSFKGQYLAGPLGLIPLHEGNRPGVLFNFWRADTNFRITNRMVEIINWVDGVESFNEMTPYRFRISVAKLFEEDSVKQQIDKQLLEHLKKRDMPKNVVDAQKWESILNSRYKYWAIIIQNSGKQFIFGDDEKSIVKDKVGIFKKVHNDVLEVIYSWDKK